MNYYPSYHVAHAIHTLRLINQALKIAQRPVYKAVGTVEGNTFIIEKLVKA